MSYQALYRVWRPQQFSDVVGQEHVTKTLQNALLHNKISHAYLFSGPRGTGKTSAAKILAKAVNCDRPSGGEPCNQCRTCIGITDGSISDVIEIDAASNNGVDEIRDIRDKVKYAPSVAKFKVYIIDEVHMLSIGAFNALLKTLEEPPKHVIFILATTEPHKIPLTILSRCQRFDFKRISSNAIVGRLKHIVSDSNIDCEDQALQIIARAADGGMRDALSLLDQAISFSRDTVTADDALTVTGAVSQNFLNRMALAVKENNVAEGLEILEELLHEGKDPVRFVEDFILFFRDMLLFKSAPKLEGVFERVMLDDEFQTLAEQFERNDIYKIIELLSQTQQEMRWTNHPRIFLEVAIVKLCHSSQVKESPPSDEIKQLMNKISQLETELKELKEKGAAANQDQPAPVRRKVQRSSQRSFQIPLGKVNSILSEATKNDLNMIKSSWGEMMSRLIPSHAALLKEAEPAAASPAAFIIKFKHEIHCGMAMEKPDFVSAVKNLMKELTGKDLDFVGVPEEQWIKIREEFLKGYREGENISEDKSEKEEDPLIAEAVKLFGSDLIEIKD